MDFIPLIVTAFFSAALLVCAHWILIARHPEIGNERMFPRHLILIGLTIACVVGTALALPVSESSRNQLIGLIGLVVSGIFAFSSSTIFSNLMAGIMLRVTRPFRTGDFVSVGDYFGRVAERGLLDTELQTENRELIACPNTFLITNPVSVVRSSGTVVSTTLSLGYDVHHSTAEKLLLKAAHECGLNDPFVQITELGNYSITYKTCGILTDVKSLLTTRSNLCRCILDTLHGNGIEIMSPTIMSQRRLAGDSKMIPVQVEKPPPDNLPVAEQVVFDKAEKAEQIENEKQKLLDRIQECKNALEDAPEDKKKELKETIEESQEKLKELEKSTDQPDQNRNAPEFTTSAEADKQRQ
jgi:small conductance mechanosensitive channel